jgi:hypothetical protein|nr:MAG TPA: hypothetical protein [Caudoviricetes sp.]
MGLNPQTIGKIMPNGQAGSYARQPDMIINTKPLGGADNVQFGMPLKYDSNGDVVLMGASSTDTQFVGIASKEIKSSLSYLDQNVGEYAPKDAVSVFQRGSINVKCQKGTPKAGGDIYIRVTASEAAPTAVVGGFEAEADTTAANTIKLTNCQWAGAKDANGIAELRILTMINA